MIKTEIDVKNYVFKIYFDGELFATINEDYGKFNLIVDLLGEGMSRGEVMSFF
jgi:hypothetical protein